MSRLEEASARLQSAIERLDRVAAAQVRAGSQDVELRSALLDAKQENARLQAVSSQTGDRLDSAIARLRTILEA